MVAQILLGIAKGTKGIVRKGMKPLLRESETFITSIGPSVTTFERKAVTSTKKTIKSTIQKTLDSYNAKKLATSAEHGTSQRILTNWRESFGVKNKDGVYQNAIEHLQKTGSIDKYILERCPELKGTKDFEKVKSLLTGYLEKNLDIYTYERIQKILSGFNKDICEKLKKGAVIYVPDKSKSYGIIADIYKTINPDAKVITGWNALKNYSKTQKDISLVVLDDCLVSGESALKNYNSILEGCSNVKDVDMYVLAAFKEGVSKLPKGINIHYDGQLKDMLRNSEYFKQGVDNKYKNLLMQFLGSGGSGYNSSSAIMFPYMAPNNNSLFATQMIKQIFSGPECAIKGFSTSIAPNEKVATGLASVIEKLRKAS